MSMLVAFPARALFVFALCCATSMVAVTSVARAQPPGGFSSGYRPDPGEIVDRMDENKNGQIDVDEMQGRARFFLESLARDNGLDLNKPIGKDKLRDMLKARFGGGSSSGGSSSGGSSSSSRDNDRYRSSKFNEPAAPIVQGFGAASAADGSPKVPGFGPPPSSESWDVLKQKYGGRVVDEIEEALDRSDRDRDGFLDREEVKNGRFRGDPMEYDRNLDGKLSRSELAVRYQERESGGSSNGGSSGSSGNSSSSSSNRGSYGGGPPGGFSGGYGPPGGYGGGPPGGYGGGYGFRGPPPGGSSSSSGGSSSGGSSFSGGGSSYSRGPTSSGSSSGAPSSGAPSSSSPAPSSSGSSSKEKDLQERVAKMADQILRIYDADKNGEIGKEEMAKVAAAYQKADYDANGRITKDELAKYAMGLVAPSAASTANGSTASGSSSGGSGGSGGSSGGPSRSTSSSRNYGSSTSRSTASKSGERRTYRFLAAVERLPQGLPEWFAANDADADGQIAMSEFSQSWNDAKVKEFAGWDQNGDGIITARECLSKSP